MQELIDKALAEDLGEGDLTSAAVVAEGTSAHARIEQRAPGVVVGLDVAEAVFRTVDSTVRFRAAVQPDGWREPGVVAELEGPARAILAGERVALNFLGRLSGIATLTARYVEAVQGTGVEILDTRKTTPGLRELEKQAVVAGGGVNHRAGLHDAILVKENHSALAGGVEEATVRALENAPDGVPVEIECATFADVEAALSAGAERLLLDNMHPDELRAAVERRGGGEAGAGRAQLEASGGITLDNVREVAETGIDQISIGALTHSAPALDFSLLLEPA